MECRAEGRADGPSLLAHRDSPPMGCVVGNNDFIPSRRPTRKMEFEVGGDTDSRLAVMVISSPAAWMNSPKSLRLF